MYSSHWDFSMRFFGFFTFMRGQTAETSGSFRWGSISLSVSFSTNESASRHATYFPFAIFRPVLRALPLPLFFWLMIVIWLSLYFSIILCVLSVEPSLMMIMSRSFFG